MQASVNEAFKYKNFWSEFAGLRAHAERLLWLSTESPQI